MQGQRSLITPCPDDEFVGIYWWTDHSCCEIFKPISEEEFLRRCTNKTNLKDIESALQLCAWVTEVTLRSDHDDVSPESPLNSNPKSITLPDCLRSVCCFLPHLKNCFVTSEQQQQGVRLSALLFQKVANMEYYLLDALGTGSVWTNLLSNWFESQIWTRKGFIPTRPATLSRCLPYIPSESIHVL